MAPSTGYAIADVAALRAIGASDLADNYARLLANDGSGRKYWVAYDASATSGDYRPSHNPTTGYWKKVEAAGKVPLASDLTLYFRTDGNDSNNGLVNSSGGAFATPQAAIDYATKTFDIGAYSITIKQGNSGTFNLSTTLLAKQAVGAGRIILEGDTTTPSNCVLSLSISGSGPLFRLPQCSTVYEVRGFTLQRTSGIGSCLQVETNATLEYKNNVFGSCTEYHVNILGGVCNLIGSCAITGSAGIHVIASGGGFFNSIGTSVITLSGTPNFSLAFAYGSSYAILNWISSVSFTGSGATGSKYTSSASYIGVPSGDINYFPGSSPGATANGGFYIAS